MSVPEKPVWLSQLFKVSKMTRGWRPDLGGCLFIQCANEDHKLEVWYSPNGETASDYGWLDVRSAVNREKPVWLSSKFKVSSFTQGWQPELGGCLVSECANEDHKLQIWYSPNGETGNSYGWVEISSAVNEKGIKEV